MLLVCWTQACENFILFSVTHLPESSKCKILQDNIILFFPYNLRQISRLFSHLLMCYILILRSHSETSHSVEFLWTSDQPIADTSTWKQTALTRDIYPCLQQGLNLQFQPVRLYIPVPYKIIMWLLFLMIVLVVITSVSTFFPHHISLCCGCYFSTLTRNCYIHLSAVCSAEYSILVLLLQCAHAAISHTPFYM
jgi:hypothetical protein